MDTYNDRLNSIHEKVDEELHKHYKKVEYFNYSAYPINENLPVNNLNEVAVQGKMIFYSPRNEFWGGDSSKDYVSKVLENPTWLELCVHSYKAMRKNKDFHHCFFEGIKFHSMQEESSF